MGVVIDEVFTELVTPSSGKEESESKIKENLNGANISSNDDLCRRLERIHKRQLRLVAD